MIRLEFWSIEISGRYSSTSGILEAANAYVEGVAKVKCWDSPVHPGKVEIEDPDKHKRSGLLADFKERRVSQDALKTHAYPAQAIPRVLWDLKREYPLLSRNAGLFYWETLIDAKPLLQAIGCSEAPTRARQRVELMCDLLLPVFGVLWKESQT